MFNSRKVIDYIIENCHLTFVNNSLYTERIEICIVEPENWRKFTDINRDYTLEANSGSEFDEVMMSPTMEQWFDNTTNFGGAIRGLGVEIGQTFDISNVCKTCNIGWQCWFIIVDSDEYTIIGAASIAFPDPEPDMISMISRNNTMTTDSVEFDSELIRHHNIFSELDKALHGSDIEKMVDTNQKKIGVMSAKQSFNFEQRMRHVVIELGDFDYISCDSEPEQWPNHQPSNVMFIEDFEDDIKSNSE